MKSTPPPACRERAPCPSGTRRSLTAVLALLAVTGFALGQAPAGLAGPVDCTHHEAQRADEPGLPCAVLAARAVWLSSAGPEVDEVLQFRLATATSGDRWFGPDKLMHFGVSAMLTLSTQYVLVRRMDLPDRRAWPVSAGTALAFGAFKELADNQRPHRPLFSWRDMAWNAAGVATAVAIILL